MGWAQANEIPWSNSPSLTAAKGKWVYTFGGGKASGPAGVRNLLGGKGRRPPEMAHLGLPVPPGFTISTEVCTYFLQNGKTYPKDLQRQVEAALAEVGRITGQKFGDGKNPLLVSVRSGARASMPGMLDTVLNLGLGEAGLGRAARVGEVQLASHGAKGAAYPSVQSCCQYPALIV
jgi:pyruvate,orthophosphate dikinase